MHELSVHTVGGVISPGEPIMLIVPDADALTVEAKSPAGHRPVSRPVGRGCASPAFNQRSTPELNGTLSRISADVSEDQKTATLEHVDEPQLPSRITRSSVSEVSSSSPECRVEAFIQVTPRTTFSDPVRPIHDQVIRAFREK